MISNNFWAAVGFSLVWGEIYIAATLFHIPFVLIDFNGGIPWQKPARLLAFTAIGVVAAIYFLMRDIGRLKKMRIAKMPNQSTDPTP